MPFALVCPSSLLNELVVERFLWSRPLECLALSSSSRTHFPLLRLIQCPLVYWWTQRATRWCRLLVRLQQFLRLRLGRRSILVLCRNRAIASPCPRQRHCFLR